MFPEWFHISQQRQAATDGMLVDKGYNLNFEEKFKTAFENIKSEQNENVKRWHEEVKKRLAELRTEAFKEDLNRLHNLIKNAKEVNYFYGPSLPEVLNLENYETTYGKQLKLIWKQMNKTKKCKDCLFTKPVELFYKVRKNTSIYDSYCKECRNLRGKFWKNIE